MPRHLRTHVLWKFGEVFRIAVRHNDMRDVVSMRRDAFLTNATNWQYATAERDLTGHRNVATHGYASERARECGRQGNAGRRTILGRRSCWEMHVNIACAIKVCRQSKRVRARADIAQCGRRRFFDDVTQRTRKLQTSASGHDTNFDFEEIAANTDHESGSKTYLDTMAQYVRDEPQVVVRLLTLV